MHGRLTAQLQQFALSQRLQAAQLRQVSANISFSPLQGLQEQAAQAEAAAQARLQTNEVSALRGTLSELQRCHAEETSRLREEARVA